MPRIVGRSFGIAVGLLAGAVTSAGAQTAVRDAVALEFHGFRAGARLEEIAARVAAIDGTRLRCVRAKADRRVTECRSLLADPDLGGPVELWLSAIDSVAGVLTISGEVAPDQLDAWRSRLEQRYGRVGARVQGPQWMMQWTRRDTMIRLTWRIGRGERVASVSVVDGRTLDAWGRERARQAALPFDRSPG